MIEHHGNDCEAAQAVKTLDLAQTGVTLFLDYLALRRCRQRFRVIGLLLQRILGFSIPLRSCRFLCCWFLGSWLRLVRRYWCLWLIRSWLWCLCWLCLVSLPLFSRGGSGGGGRPCSSYTTRRCGRAGFCRSRLWGCLGLCLLRPGLSRLLLRFRLWYSARWILLSRGRGAYLLRFTGQPAADIRWFYLWAALCRLPSLVLRRRRLRLWLWPLLLLLIKTAL